MIVILKEQENIVNQKYISKDDFKAWGERYLLKSSFLRIEIDFYFRNKFF
jgi:hypothetical protein